MLQWYVSRLRGLLGDVLIWTGQGYRLTVAPGEFDVHTFEGLGAAGLRALAAGDWSRACADMMAALGLASGPPYADVPSTPILEAEVTRLNQQRRALLAARLRDDLAAGQCEECLPELTALACDHPFDEEFQYLLVTALYESGRAADALVQCRKMRETFVDELGIEPGVKLRESSTRE